MSRTLTVWWDNQVVGFLTQNQHGELGFAYGVDWLADKNAPALSVSLPKRDDAFSQRECRPFFGGFLPEEGQRNAVAKALGVSPRNDFALLDRLGGDVAGAFQLLQIGEVPATQTRSDNPTPLTDDELVNLLNALPLRPMLAGENGLRLSLAGAQSKLPVVLVNGKIALPLLGQPTTHILKPPISRFVATTENEAFTMNLASAIGLDVAPAQAHIVQGRSFLLVDRYDRTLFADGLVTRVHQEDFCQALGISSELKYASEGGPNLKNCFELLRRVSARPAQDVLKLLDAVIFNLIVGNADAHGKNFSILYSKNGARLAPLYDLLSTVAYPELSQKFAMKIGKRETLADMNQRTWIAFATDSGLGAPIIRRRVTEICDQIIETTSRVAEKIAKQGLNQTEILKLSAVICERSELCAKTIL